jgi:hypothetical protein
MMRAPMAFLRRNFRYLLVGRQSEITGVVVIAAARPPNSGLPEVGKCHCRSRTADLDGAKAENDGVRQMMAINVSVS